MKNSNPVIKTAIIFLKTAIVVASVYFIYVKVISRPDFDEMVKNLEQTIKEPSSLSAIISITLLMLLNWFLETAKWKLLLRRIAPVSWLKGFRSVLSGVTISVFTPNRMGEFAGRVMHLDSGVRIKSSLASIIGSMNQLLITIVAGGMGLLTTIENLESDNSFMYRVKFLLIFIGILFAIFIYFQMPLLARLGERYRNLRKINLYTKVFGLYPFQELLTLTFFSSLRYLVFTFQFFLVLQLFGIDLPYLQTLQVTSLIYLVMAVVPSIALSELTVRGSVALYFLTPLAGNSAGIIAASSFLWFMNLIIPAVLGALAVFYFRFYK